MKKHGGINSPSKAKPTAIFNKVTRIICAIICVTVLLSTFVACTSYASSDDMSALRNDLNSALNEIDSINSEYEAALQELDSLKAALQNTNKDLDEFKSEYENTKEELDVLKDKYIVVNQELDALNKANTEVNQELDALNKANTEANQKLEALMDSYDAAQQEIDALKGQIEDMQDQINAIPQPQKIKIYIDQGHNPTPHHNSGASGNGLYEQDITFTIGILLAELLEDDGRFEICLSRPSEDTVLGTDNNSSLDARIQGAKDFGADYFISLHINSFSDATVNGIEVYAADNGNESYEFAGSLLQGLIDSTSLRNRGVKPNPDFRVLKYATMPAVLVEMGFISNPQDAALLSESPELFVQGIYNGILSYFELEPNLLSTN